MSTIFIVETTAFNSHGVFETLKVYSCAEAAMQAVHDIRPTTKDARFRIQEWDVDYPYGYVIWDSAHDSEDEEPDELDFDPWAEEGYWADIEVGIRHPFGVYV